METPNVYPIAEPLTALGDSSLTTVLLERDCLTSGLSTFRTSGQNFIAVDPAGARTAFVKAGTALNSRPSSPLTKDKHSTRLLLRRRGLPAPEGRRFQPDDVSSAKVYAEELGYPVVLKPLAGTQGRGVVPGIQDATDLEWAFQDIQGTPFAQGDVLLEEHIDGETYRVIVIGGRAVSALISRRGRAVGDGERAVRELIEERRELRRMNPHLMSHPIRINDRMEHLLNRQDTGLDEVLETGRVVEFTYGSNTHQGGEPAQVLSEMEASIPAACVDAVAAVPGLGFAGVDIIVPDIHRPLAEQRVGICEINSVPAADSHEYPLYGEPVSVTRELVKHVAGKDGLAMSARSSEVSLAVEIHGDVSRPHYLNWIAERAQALGLDGEVERLESDCAEATLRGDVDHAAVWTALAFRGAESEQAPAATSMEVRHV